MQRIPCQKVVEEGKAKRKACTLPHPLSDTSINAPHQLPGLTTYDLLATDIVGVRYI